MTNILLCGVCGNMGHAVVRAADGRCDVNIAAGFDIKPSPDSDFPVYTELSGIREQIDAIIDFSHPSMTDAILDYAASNHIPAVICTTGLSGEQITHIDTASKQTPVFFSANMSLGVNLIIDLVQRAAKILSGNFDIEIVEKHHNQKLDAPSGTALAIADAISDVLEYEPEYTYDRHNVRKKRDKHEIGIHSVRGGTIVGEHSVIFAGRDEVIEVKHTASSKEVFAVGALSAAAFLKDAKPGLYSMKELIAAQ
ncbi:MAG: 4-hydroxy-tetrahydrodipicolinate reductase [Monoglobaceae bacterium]